MTKKVERPRLDQGRLAAARIRLVIDRKGDDVPALARGRGLEPIGRAVWRVINGARK